LRAQVVEVDTEWVAGDLPPDHLGFDFSNVTYAGYTWDFPTLVQGTSLVCRGAYVLSGSRHHPRGPDPEVVLDGHLRALGLDPRAYRRRRFAERGLSASTPISRPRTLLVGEAAGIDPMFGEGIAQGILYGALAARYLAKRIPPDHVAFADWRRVVLTSRVGADLVGRSMIADAFFGPLRLDFERYVRSEPALIQAGLRYFGGDPSLASWLRAAAGAGRYAATRLLSGSAPLR
jgi:flavin-dependent dehydrogenase